MKTQFTTAFIKANCGCYNQDDLQKTYEQEGKTSCFEAEDCEVTLSDVWKSGIPVKDKYWFLYNNALDKREKINLTLELLSIVFDVVDAKHKEQVSTYFSVVELYIKGAVDWNTLYKAWVELRDQIPPGARGGWVVSRCDFCSSNALGGFGLYLLCRPEVKEQVVNLIQNIMQ